MKQNLNEKSANTGRRISTLVKTYGILMAIFLFLDAGAQTYGDYTLYSTKNSTKAYLLDMSGSVYHSWTFASNKQTGYSSYLLPGGTILRTIAHQGNTFQGGGMTGEVQKVDYNGNVLWDYVYSTTSYCCHHDVCPMPNGNVLLIAYESKTAAQVTQAGCSQSILMWPDKIVEIEPSGTTGGNVVWEWHVWDHLCQNVNPAKDNYYPSIVLHPELLNINYNTQKDWMHVNGIDYNEALDQIVFSSHFLNEFYVIDHSTTTAEAASHSGGNSGKGGDFLYRWGNPAAYQATGTTIFNVVHDAHWVPADCPKANWLGAFNNKGGAGSKSCIDLINPPYDGYNYSITPGSAYLPATYDWRHTYSGQPTQDEGSSQQLPNGNTLICISFSGYIYEIDSNQTVVWSKQVSGTMSNARRYTACYINNALTVDATATPSTICTGGSSQLNATPAGGSNYVFSWTSNPPGYTSDLQNPVVSPLVTTTYIVNVTSSTCTASDSTTVTVNQLPATPSISQSGDTLWSSASSGNQWYMNSLLLMGETNQYLVPSSNGSYQVQVTDQNNCVSAMSNPYTVAWLGIFDNRGIGSVRIWPNPTSGMITISGSSLENKDVEICIFNSCGKKMLTLKNQLNTDISGFEKGIYFIRILSSDGEMITKKIILSK